MDDNDLSNIRRQWKRCSMWHANLVRVLTKIWHLQFLTHDLIVLNTVWADKFFYINICSFGKHMRRRTIIERHPTEKNFHSKARQWFPISGFLTHVAYLSSFPSYSRKLDLIATETPPCRRNSFIRKPDPNFLLVACYMFCLNLTFFE
jgi:hypothetical protein